MMRSPDKIFELINYLPKADLHLHLNGLFNTNIVCQILKEEGIIIPRDFNLATDYVIPKRVGSLQKYLKPWEILHLIPKTINNFRKLISSAFQYLASENIKYAELRTSVIYLSNLFKIRLEDTLNLIIDIFEEYSKKYVVDFNIIITIQRSLNAHLDLNRLLEAYCNIGKPNRIVALDLAGNEDCPMPNELPNIFRKAKYKYGLSITIHAGETGNIDAIYDAIYLYAADRIGHGCSATKDLKLMEILYKNQICVEVCPISNYLTGAYHNIPPYVTFQKFDVPFVISSDNPAIHQKGLSNDYMQFLKEGGKMDKLLNMYNEQLKYSFKRK